jgi:hypothetical protein
MERFDGKLEPNVYDFRWFHWQRWQRRVEECRQTGEVFLSDSYIPPDAPPARVLKFPLERVVQLQTEPPEPVA